MMGKRSKKRDSKSILTFDDDARKEWLKGFSKRKKERQQRAKDDLAKLLKEEKTRQREEFREKMKKSEAKYLEKLKDVEEILKEKTKAYECGGKTVEITEYDFTKEEEMVGANEGEDNTSENDKPKDNNSDDSDGEDNEGPADVLPKKMPKKMSKTAVKIEKRLFRLNNKKKKSKQKSAKGKYDQPLKTGKRKTLSSNSRGGKLSKGRR